MDPLVAAATLGVSPDAAPDEVRRAFRTMVRSAHPDVVTDHPAIAAPDVDIDSLTEARDVLLARGDVSAPGPDDSEAADTAASRHQDPGNERSAGRTGVRPPARDGRGAFAYVWPVIAVAVALFLAAGVVVAVLSFAGGASDDVVDDPNQCVLVGQSGVRAVQCNEPDAQLVVHEYSGARQCGSGSNTLVVGATTWCLRPAG